MKHRRVSQVMTPASHVISVQAGTGYKEIARLLDEHKISAMTVLDEVSHVIGVVSEADLLAKEGLLEERHAPLIQGPRARAEREKAAGTTAADLMTSPVIRIGPDEDVVQAARLMEARRVKRLPVTDAQGRLMGIVSRGDILSIFLRSDADIRDDIADGLILQTLWVDPADLDIEVREGVVHLGGQVETRSLAVLIGDLSRRSDGVVDVVNNLTYRTDDTAIEPQEAPFHGVFERRRRHS